MDGMSKRVITPRDLASGQVRIRMRPQSEDDEILDRSFAYDKTCLIEIQDFAKRLKCCKEAAQGLQLHEAIKASPHRDNRFLANRLIEMYAKFGRMEQARALFDGICSPNLFSWNILIVAYARNGDLQSTIRIFHEMPARDVITWTTMVSAYAQNDEIEEARSTFDAMPERNSVSWNVMIEAYASKGRLAEATNLYDVMPLPNVVTQTSIMGALARAGFAWEAMRILSAMQERDVIAWTVALQAFAGKGDLHHARKVFDQMPQRNLVTWNSMLQVYSRHVGGLELFHLMNLEGIAPDECTFVCVLNACSHLGFLATSLQLLASISVDHLQVPTLEHQCCIMDLLARIGKLDDAQSLLVSSDADRLQLAVPWSTLVNAARVHGDLERGAWAAKQMADVKPGISAHYTVQVHGLLCSLN